MKKNVSFKEAWESAEEEELDPRGPTKRKKKRAHQKKRSRKFWTFPVLVRLVTSRRGRMGARMAPRKKLSIRQQEENQPDEEITGEVTFSEMSANQRDQRGGGGGDACQGQRAMYTKGAVPFMCRGKGPVLGESEE